jgi:long-chain fatty acid transport protein
MNKRFPLILITFIFLVSLFGISQSVSKTNFSGVVGSGARAFGMGGAFIAVADDATAASWNPGGLGQLENVEFSFVMQNHTYNSIFPAKSSVDNFFLGPQDFSGNAFSFDFVSATFPFRIGEFKLVPQISYQRNVNFNTNSTLNNVVYRNRYSEPISKRIVDFQGTFTYSDSFSGGFDMMSFSLGTKILRGVNIGFSVNAWMNGSSGNQKYYIKGSKTYEDSLAKQSVELQYEVEKSFDINGVNFNGGILLEIMENLKLGAVYKSSFNADLEYDNLAKGDALTGAFMEIPGREIRYTGKTTLEWPDTWGAGLSFAPIDTLTFSMDYTRTNWSAAIMRNFYNAETDERAIDVYFPTMKNVTSEDKSKQLDTEQIRFGMEYVYISEDILIPFRLGMFSDSQYYKDASGEKITFIGLTGGLGIKWGPVAVDFAIMFESGSYLESNISYAATDFSEIKLFLSTIFSL